MEENNHCIKVNFTGKFVSVYIDENRVNAESLYFLNSKGQRMEEGVAIAEIQGAELKVRDVESIAIAMNESTFERFCELWREYHVENKQ